ncbi:MAG: BolA family transcriptional regulator [Alphaproteobacteria bacterium]|nr:BolA family transcriptional regulator [Alphaproteobacteria bacterium]
MSAAAIIREKLSTRFSCARLEIIDQSELHAGHAGARPGGETHFAVLIVSPDFRGLGRVARQRLVYETLAAELAGGVHALAMIARTPEEDRSEPYNPG